MAEAPLIYQLIPKVMADIGAIGKVRRNTQQGYQFRGIDDCYNACSPAMVKHGVFVVPAVTEEHREERTTRDGKGTLAFVRLRVSHKFYAPDGSHVEAVTIGEAMDSGDKASNKAMSAAMKYALIEVFAIPTEGDNDTENASPEPAPRKPAAPPKAEPKAAAPPEPKASTPEHKALVDAVTKLAMTTHEADFDEFVIGALKGYSKLAGVQYGLIEEMPDNLLLAWQVRMLASQAYPDESGFKKYVGTVLAAYKKLEPAPKRIEDLSEKILRTWAAKLATGGKKEAA